jgi:hypothetical protein
MSKEDLEFKAKIDAFRTATKGLLRPNEEVGKVLLADLLARIAAQNERAA